MSVFMLMVFVVMVTGILEVQAKKKANLGYYA